MRRWPAVPKIGWGVFTLAHRIDDERDRAGETVEVVTTGRHDPCVGLRATPIAEATTALVHMDHWLRHRGQNADAPSAALHIPPTAPRR